LGEVEQATIPARIGPYRGLGKQAAHRVDGGGGEGVSVGVDADHAVDRAGQPGHRHGSFLLVGLVESAWRAPRGASVTGHNRGLDRLLIRPAGGGSGRRRHHGRQLVTKATQVGA
jgi:hypothetical protein